MAIDDPSQPLDRLPNGDAATLALQLSENLLRNLLETIPDRIWLKDTHGIHLACNAAFAEHVGATTAEIVGTDDAHWFGKALAEEFLKADRIVIQTGQSLTLEGTMPSAQHNDSSIYEFLQTASKCCRIYVGYATFDLAESNLIMLKCIYNTQCPKITY